MNKRIKLTHIDTLGVVSRFLTENSHYEEFKLTDCSFASDIYRLYYKTKDSQEREEEIMVSLNLLKHTISESIVRNQKELGEYLYTFYQMNPPSQNFNIYSCHKYVINL